MDVAEAYCAGRRELAETILGGCGDRREILEVLRRTLWSPAFCGPDGTPTFFFPSRKWRHRFEVVGFDSASAHVENVQGRYQRLRVNGNWCLSLGEYGDADSYFRALSTKTRKKLRWLRNSYEHLGTECTEIRTRPQLDEFLELYLSQWPESDWGRELRGPLMEVYLAMGERGLNRSYLLRDESGDAVAGALGYLTDQAFNLHMLVRCPGRLDKYSPGFFLTFWLIERFLSDEPRALFLFGPGEFDYKRTFLARDLPIYRYEARTWRNVHGILRLHNRCRKQRKQRDA